MSSHSDPKMKHKMKLTFTLPKEQAEDMIETVQTDDANFKKVAQCLLDIDSEKATCRDEDMKKIDMKIETDVEGGFDEVNKVVRERMLKWVAKQCGAVVAKKKEKETENAITQQCSKASLISWSTARKTFQAGAILKKPAKPSEEEGASEAESVHLTSAIKLGESVGMAAQGRVWNSTAQPSKESRGSFQGNPSEYRSWCRSEVDSELDIETMMEYFKRYDLDQSGTINTLEELQQLSFNLILKSGLPLKVPDVEAILNTVVDIETNPWDFDRFKMWFEQNFLRKRRGTA